jgi:hypothetical protein
VTHMYYNRTKVLLILKFPKYVEIRGRRPGWD